MPVQLVEIMNLRVQGAFIKDIASKYKKSSSYICELLKNPIE